MSGRLLVGLARRGRWLVLAGVLSPVACLAAGPADEAVGEAREAREARTWLARMHEAASQRNFSGTFVVSSGGRFYSSRIAHYRDGNNQYERIEPLDGLRREVYRHNDLVASVLPQGKVVVLETRQTLGRFPSLLSSGAGRIVERYQVRPIGEGRVAGHDAQVLMLTPRDGYRFGHRLWVEKSSGMLLRSEVFDEREIVLEASAFSDLVIGVKPQPELVTRAMARFDGYRVERPRFEPVELTAEGWSLRDLPPGFEPVSSVRRQVVSGEGAQGAGVTTTVLQSIYSDGLTHVSLFIEPFRPDQHKRESLMGMGATQSLVRRQGDWWITVIGEVPVATLRGFAFGLERRR